MTSTAHDFLCSTESLEAGEQLFGSAPNNEVWFLLEYNRAWGAKVLPESGLTAPVKDWLNGHLKTTPKSNILFIRQQPKNGGGITFYVALPRETDPKLYKFVLQSYDDLLTLDIPAVINGDPAYAQHLSAEPLYLVCVNARRDRCCARYGLPLCKVLTDYAGDQVWQCSHMGGHRFAPTMLFFPHGICYARVHESEVGELIETYRAGSLYLKRLRGRVTYEPVAQAAEYYLRMETGSSDLEGLRLVEVQSPTPEQWQVRFESVANARQYTVSLTRTASGAAIHNSCHAEETTPVLQYALLSIE